MIWYDTKVQRYKILLHQMGGDPDSNFIGAYAQSRTADFFGEWSFSTSMQALTYTTTVTYIDGTTESLSLRERPKVWLEDGELAMLLNGVCRRSSWGDCYTMVQKINRSSAAHSRS